MDNLGVLLREGLRRGIISSAQVLESQRLNAPWLGAKGFIGFSCKYCCGPGKHRGNVALPVQERQPGTSDTCKVCYTAYSAFLP